MDLIDEQPAFYGVTELFYKPMKTCVVRAVLAASVLVASLVLNPLYALDDETWDTGVTIPAGSIIIDMGVFPATVGSSLTPYGLVAELVLHQIPVIWAFDPAKTSNTDIDVSVDGKSFSGGPFIISAEFADAAQSIISAWSGVQTYKTLSDTTADIYDTIVSLPNAVLDAGSGGIAGSYFANAGVISTAYYFKDPQTLDSCDDFYAMPHADPTWSGHSNLVDWNSLGLAGSHSGGYIWAACHSVSVLENVDGDGDGSPDMNFLSVDPALIHFKSPGHAGGDASYISTNFSDPQMQFLGKIDLATENGSEQIYIPKAVTTWNPGARVSVYDDPHPDGGAGGSRQEAAKLVYGRGFDVLTNGKVMYEGGHSHNKGSPDDVAAQRAYLNHWLLSGIDRRPELTTNIPVVTATPIDAGATVSLTASAVGAASYNDLYEWSDNGCGGTFTDRYAATTDYTAPITAVPLNCVITLNYQDGCNRRVFAAEGVDIAGLPNLAIAKIDSQDPVPVSGEFFYTLTVTNTGDTATNVSVVDTLPAGVALVSTAVVSPSGGSCDDASPLLTCSIPTLANGEEATITVTVTAPSSTADLFNTATVSSDKEDLDPSDNTASEPTAVREVTDLAILKTATPETGAMVGDTITFTLAASNLGPLAATNVTITDTLPAGLDYISGKGTDWACDYNISTNLVTCIYLAELGVGETATVNLNLLATAGSAVPLTNTATVYSPDFADDNLANNSSDATFEIIAAADLSMEKLLSNPAAGKGNTVDFTLVVTNDGPDPAHDVVVTDRFAFAGEDDGYCGYNRYDNLANYSVTFPDGGVASFTGTLPYASIPTITSPSGLYTIELTFDPNLAAPKDLSASTPFNGQTVTLNWTMTSGSLLKDESLTLTYRAVVGSDTNKCTNATEDPSLGSTTLGTVNVASVDSSTPDPYLANNTDEESIIKDRRGIDLELFKAGPSIPGTDVPPTPIDPLMVGTNFEYTISVIHNGTEDLVKTNVVTIVDTLPAGVTYVGYRTAENQVKDYQAGNTADSWSCTPSGTVPEVLTCTFTITADNYKSTEYLHDLKIEVTADTDGELLNRATVTYVDTVKGYIDINESNNTDKLAIQAYYPPIDVAVTKSVDTPAPALIGDTVTFTVTFSNYGYEPGADALPGGDATGVAVSDPLPAGMTLVSASATQGSYVNGAWFIGTVPDETTVTLTLTATIDTLAAVTNTARVSGLDQDDYFLDNNTAAASVDIPDADVRIEKSLLTIDPINLGEEGVFEITVTNDGPVDATNINVQDALPSGLAYVSHSESTGLASESSGVITWVLDLVSGDSATLTINFTANTASLVTNTARILFADQLDGNLGNNVATADVDAAAADITVTKSVVETVDNAGNPGVIEPNDVVTWTVSATNNGPDDASNVVITESLPPASEFTFSSASTLAGSYVAPDWTIPAIAVGETVTLDIVGTINSFGTIVNSASLTSMDQTPLGYASPDLNINNDLGTATALSGGEADLEIVKSASTSTPTEGGTVVYTITVTNYGPLDATGVKVQDTLPVGLTYVSDTDSSNTSLAGQVLTWTVPGTIPVDGFVELQITTSVDAGTAGTSLLNYVAITAANQGDPDGTNNGFTAAVNVLPPATVTVTKTTTAAGAVFAANTQFSYVLHEESDGVAPVNFALDTDGDDADGATTSRDVTVLPEDNGTPYVYVLEELAKPGWVIDSMSCTGGTVTYSYGSYAGGTFTAGGGASFAPGDTAVRIEGIVSGDALSCDVTNKEVATIKITKNFAPIVDEVVDLRIFSHDPDTLVDTLIYELIGVTHAGTTGPIQVDAGGFYQIGEHANNPGSLQSYTITTVCVNGGGTAVVEFNSQDGVGKTFIETETFQIARDATLAQKTIVCTITNIKKGKVNIIKNAFPADTTDFPFSFTYPQGGGTDTDLFTLDGENIDTDGDGFTSSYEIQASSNKTYTVVELQDQMPAGWVLEEILCSESISTTGSSIDPATGTVTFVVEPGEEVNCTYVNIKQGQITIVKNSDVDGGSFDFDRAYEDPDTPLLLDGTADLTLTTAGNTASQVYTVAPSALYTFNELPLCDATECWELVDLNCEITAPGSGTTSFQYGTVDGSFVFSGDATYAPGETAVVIDMAAGDEVTCTFANESRTADLVVTKTDNSDTYTPGQGTTYVITVDNNGPANVVGARIQDTLPAGLTVDGNWTCSVITGPASCVSGSPDGTGATGAGNINQLVDIAAGAQIEFSVPVIYASNPGVY